MATAEIPLGEETFSSPDRLRRSGSADASERPRDPALAALAAVSSYLDWDEDLPSFFGRLSAAVAELTGATRAAFWRLGSRGMLTVQPAAHGFADASSVHHVRVPLAGKGQGTLDRVVVDEDSRLVKGSFPSLDTIWREAGMRDVKNSIAAAWRAGERRIGVVAAYNSPRGFTAPDVRVLRLVGMAAGLVWQYKESEEELGHTAVRLEEAMAARRHLLNNIAAGGDEARRRFASALHDDSLQLLTGAELQLERMRADPSAQSAEQLDHLHETLRKVEDSLRRLLTNVSPEPLELPNDIAGAIRERLALLRTHAGIEANGDIRLPSEVPDAIQAILLKNVAEALTNVEKHAHATQVAVVAEALDGGVRVEISDNGTGFVIAESEHTPGHIGLVALRERAQLAGGWYRVHSDPGSGTRVEFWVPLSL